MFSQRQLEEADKSPRPGEREAEEATLTHR